MCITLTAIIFHVYTCIYTSKKGTLYIQSMYIQTDKVCEIGYCNMSVGCCLIYCTRLAILAHMSIHTRMQLYVTMAHRVEEVTTAVTNTLHTMFQTPQDMPTALWVCEWVCMYGHCGLPEKGVHIHIPCGHHNSLGAREKSAHIPVCLIRLPQEYPHTLHSAV